MSEEAAPKITKAQALAETWRRGNLKYKLDVGQRELYDLYYSGLHRRMTWLLARRSGKSFALVVLSIEQCLRKPNSIVKFLAPTKTQVDTVLRPIFKKIIEDCPESLRPNYVARQYIYYFTNGSEIQLAGTDNGHAEKLRGGDSDIWIIDEAGSCDDLDYIIKSILSPTTLTTKGKSLIS
ncbi:MAG TPA: terminase family protein, partial [Aquella sp.]|nr:terminase family protein [Aquella sp.]